MKKWKFYCNYLCKPCTLYSLNLKYWLLIISENKKWYDVVWVFFGNARIWAYSFGIPPFLRKFTYSCRKILTKFCMSDRVTRCKKIKILTRDKFDIFLTRLSNHLIFKTFGNIVTFNLWVILSKTPVFGHAACNACACGKTRVLCFTENFVRRKISFKFLAIYA